LIIVNGSRCDNRDDCHEQCERIIERQKGHHASHQEEASERDLHNSSDFYRFGARYPMELADDVKDPNSEDPGYRYE
jgi:hypothetical protein